MSKILIIEDETAIAELEKDYLELSDFEVMIETSGDVGLSRALKEEFDLIILDLMLPGMDGFEVCRQIRQIKNIPILMVSAKREDIDKIRGLGLGADDYITKPFSPSELVARVKAHLASYQRLVGTDAPERMGGNPWNQNRQNGTSRLYQRGRKEFYYKGIRLALLSGTKPEPGFFKRRAVSRDLGNGVGRRYCDSYRTY